MENTVSTKRTLALGIPNAKAALVPSSPGCQQRANSWRLTPLGPLWETRF